MDANSTTGNGWILCPSKRFPGKFYYFNVLSGQAVWSVNDAEIKSLKPGSNNQGLAEKSHNYPEPTLPPIELSNHSGPSIPPSDQITRNVPNTHLQSIPQQAYGQIVFPNCFSNPDVNTIIWAPISLLKKSTTDQITQTCDIEREILVQSCDQPLCKRFRNYVKPVINFNTENKIINKCMLEKLNNMATPTEDMSTIENVSGNTISKPQMLNCRINELQLRKDVSGCQRKQDLSIPSKSFIRESSHFLINNNRENTELNVSGNVPYQNMEKDKTPEIKLVASNNKLPSQEETTKNNNFIPESSGKFSTKSFIKDPDLKLKTNSHLSLNCAQESSLSCFQKIENPVTPFGNQMLSKCQPNMTLLDKQKPTFTLGSKDDIAKSEYEHKDVHLESDDLRYLLAAKRRKSVDEPVVGKKTREETELKSKKRVLFNLIVDQYEETEACHDKMQGHATKACNPTITYLKNLSQPHMNNDSWYIVVDAQILIDNFEFIEEFITSDEDCKLLIPHAVRWEVDATCVGHSGGRTNLLVARHLARLLSNPPEYIVVQSTPSEANSIFLVDDTVECCLEAIHTLNYHVVLITNDSRLRTKALTKEIPTFQLDEIFDNFIPKQEVNFDIKNLRVTIYNSTQRNLFLQDPNDCQPSIFEDKVAIAVDSFQKGLCDNSVRPFTPPIRIDMLKITRRTISEDIQQNNTSQIVNDRDNTSDTPSEIGYVIHRLKLKDIDPNTNENLEKNETIPEHNSKIQFEHDSLKSIKRTFQVQSGGTPLQNGAATTFQTQNEQKAAFVIQKDDERPLENGNSSYSDERVVARMDELICSLTQIMEDALSELLQFQSYNLLPPWTMPAAVELAKASYNQPTISTIADKISLLLLRYKEKDKTPMWEAKDFIDLLRLSTNLIQTLKTLQNTKFNYKVLLDAETSLQMLSQTVADESTEIESEARTPTRSGSDLNDRPKDRRNFAKTSSDIIKYLRDHFDAWKELDYRNVSLNKKNENRTQAANVVRTYGKNLCDIKIDNSKTISFGDHKRSEHQSKDVENRDENVPRTDKELEGPKVIGNFQNIDVSKRPRDSNYENENNLTEDKTNGPKFIRNLNRIDLFEAKLVKRNTELDLDKIDYEIDEAVSPGSSDRLSFNDHDNIINDGKNTENIQHYMIRNDDQSPSNDANDKPLNLIACGNTECSPFKSPSLINEQLSSNNDSKTNDSGYESLLAFPLVKTFLTDLSCSLKMVYEFVIESISVVRSELQENQKTILRDKTNEIQSHLDNIIIKLKSIVNRELNAGRTVRELLIRSGAYDSSDKRLTRYTQVVTKCLEQALMLSMGLNTLRAAINEDFDSLPSNTADNPTNTKFLNIFE